MANSVKVTLTVGTVAAPPDPPAALLLTTMAMAATMMATTAAETATNDEKLRCSTGAIVPIRCVCSTGRMVPPGWTMVPGSPDCGGEVSDR